MTSRNLFSKEINDPLVEHRVVRQSDPDFDGIKRHLAHFLFPEGTDRDLSIPMKAQAMEMMASILEQIPSSQIRNERISIPNLKRMIRDEMWGRIPESLRNRSDIYVIIYYDHETMHTHLIRETARLPLLPIEAGGCNMPALSIDFGGYTRVLGLRLVPSPMPDPSEVLIEIHMPGMPGIIAVTSPDKPGLVTSLPNNTKDVEMRALSILVRWSNCPLLVQHEPNGSSTFPDFEVIRSGEPWDVEVTRPLAGIYHRRIVHVGGRDEKAEMSQLAFNSVVTDEDEERAIEKAIASKTPKRNPNHLYCLVFVDDELPMETKQKRPLYEQQDYNAFDAVVVVSSLTMTGYNIKGDWIDETET